MWPRPRKRISTARVALIERQLIFERDGREHGLVRRGHGQVAFAQRDVAQITRALFVVNRAAAEALVVADEAAQEFDELREAAFVPLAPVDRALGGEVRARRGVRDELHAGEALGVDLIAYDVVVVPVRVDDDADGLVRECAERREGLARGRGARLRIHDYYAVVAYDEEAVRLDGEARWVFAHGRVYSLGELHHVELRGA